MAIVTNIEIKPEDSALVFREDSFELFLPPEPEDPEEPITDSAFMAYAISLALQNQELMDQITLNAERELNKPPDDERQIN